MNRRFDRAAGHRADGGIDGGVFKDGVIEGVWSGHDVLCVSGLCHVVHVVY